MIVKLLTEHHLEFLSLNGGCRGSSESTLVKMSNCRKSHAAAQMMYFLTRGLTCSHQSVLSRTQELLALLTTEIFKPRIQSQVIRCIILYGIARTNTRSSPPGPLLVIKQVFALRKYCITYIETNMRCRTV